MISQSPDTSLEAEEIQIELFRKSGIPRRLSIARSLSQTVIYLSRRAIKRANPFMSDNELDIAFVANHYGLELAERLRIYMEHRK